MKEKKLISFVIPCYNSTNTIAGVVEEIDNTIKTKMSEFDYEIILSNDGSPDGTTFDAIKKIVDSNHRVKGINLSRNFGQPGAVMAAMNKAKGDYIVCGDDDGQTPFDELPKLIEKLEGGYDAVEAKYAVREKRSIFRKFGTLMNEGMATWLINKPKGLELTTYWAVKRFVADEMIAYPNSYPYLGGLMMRATQNVCNVDVTHRNRKAGKSGYNLKKMIQLWLNGFTSFSVKPLRLMSVFGVIIAVGGFAWGIYIILNKIITNDVPAGYSSMMSINLILFGILFVFMGLIGEYVGRIYMSLNKAPQYIVKEYVENTETGEGSYSSNE